MRRQMQPLGPAGIDVCGVKLVPGGTRNWYGGINGKRFVIRRDVAGGGRPAGRTPPRTFAAFVLPAAVRAVPVAEAETLEAVVLLLVDLYKRVCPGV